MKHSEKILITPLDWGLGHATRCIPIINELLHRGCEVQIASAGNALVLLKQEFPALTFHKLPAYNVRYFKTFPLAISLVIQLPKFISRIKKEHEQTERIVRDEKVDFVISDNRYGCWTTLVPSIFITHQVDILMPVAFRWMEGIINYFNHRQIRKFKNCWVPDEVKDRITGKLTEPYGLNVTYIGMLSRFEKIDSLGKRYDLLVLLSGPEPQRTVMEKKLLKKLAGSRLKVMFVRGIPGDTTSKIEVHVNVNQANHLSAIELNKLILQSEIVVSRPGYSTVMDLAKLNKKAIFIPTPGQTEQEYLASELQKRKMTFTTSLAELDIDKAIELSSGYSGLRWQHNKDLLTSAINALLA